MLLKLIKFHCLNCKTSRFHEVQLGVGVCVKCNVANWVPSDSMIHGNIRLKYLNRNPENERCWSITSNTLDVEYATEKDLYSWGVLPRGLDEEISWAG